MHLVGFTIEINHDARSHEHKKIQTGFDIGILCQL